MIYPPIRVAGVKQVKGNWYEVKFDYYKLRQKLLIYNAIYGYRQNKAFQEVLVRI